MVVRTVVDNTLASGASLAYLKRNICRLSNGSLACCYKKSDGTYNQIYVSESSDGGTTWTETQVTSTSYTKTAPCIWVDDHDSLWLGYGGKEDTGDAAGVSNYRTKAFGGNWSERTKIGETSYGYQGVMGICSPSGRIWISWLGHAYSKTYIRYSDDNGASWSSDTDLSSYTYWDGTYQVPVLQINPATGYPAIIYQIISSAKYIWRMREFNGSSWDAYFDASDPAESTYRAHFAYDESGNIHFVGERTISGKNVISYKVKSGGSWGSYTNVSSLSYSNYCPFIILNVSLPWYIQFGGNYASSAT